MTPCFHPVQWSFLRLVDFPCERYTDVLSEHSLATAGAVTASDASHHPGSRLGPDRMLAGGSDNCQLSDGAMRHTNVPLFVAGTLHAAQAWAARSGTFA